MCIKDKKKLDFRCVVCKKRHCLEELKELGFVETIADITVVTCPSCGEETNI